MATHRDLRIWQAGMTLVAECYRVSAEFPASERFGLAGQLRRAAVSVPSNIAEGKARGSDREFVRFLEYARGSLAELDTQLEIAATLGFMTPAAHDGVMPLLMRTDRLLARFIARIRKSVAAGDARHASTTVPTRSAARRARAVSVRPASISAQRAELSTSAAREAPRRTRHFTAREAPR